MKDLAAAVQMEFVVCPLCFIWRDYIAVLLYRLICIYDSICTHKIWAYIFFLSRSLAHTHMLIYIYIIHAHMLPSYTMMKHDGSWGLEPHARTPKSYCRSHLDCRKAARFSLWKTKHRKVGKWNILDIIGIGRYHLYHPGNHFWGVAIWLIIQLLLYNCHFGADRARWGSKVSKCFSGKRVPL